MAVKIWEYDTGAGVLGYSVHSEEITIEYYRGRDLDLSVPAMIADLPVTMVEKKAFLGSRTLRSIEFPQTIRRFGDYAIASCHQLERVTLPTGGIETGLSIFYNCEHLKQLHTEGREEDVSYLLAATTGILNAPYLLDTIAAGSKDWLGHLDGLILHKLRISDEEGFSNMLLCGEEDYVGNDSNFETYCSHRRQEKIRLLFLRLLHPVGLKEDNRKEMEEYLRGHSKGCSSEETWTVVLKEHGDEVEYYDLMKDLGCITDENLQGMLADMKDSHAEMKAHLLRMKNDGGSGGDDFFDSLDL